MKSEADIYINMVDGVKEDKAFIEKIAKTASKSWNLKECNSQTNKGLAKREYYNCRNALTYKQKKLIDRINEERIKIGEKPYKVSGTDTRKSVTKLIGFMIKELEEKGVEINISRDTCRCSECRHYRSTLGGSGYCNRVRRPTRATRGCAGGEK